MTPRTDSLIAGAKARAVPPADPCRNPDCDRHCEPPGAAYRGKQGYCARCYYRWRNNGFPPGGPLAPRRSRTGPVTVTLEDYAWLRSQGVPRDAAAARVGVVRTTAWKYERLLGQCQQRGRTAA